MREEGKKVGKEEGKEGFVGVKTGGDEVGNREAEKREMGGKSRESTKEKRSISWCCWKDDSLERLLRETVFVFLASERLDLKKKEQFAKEERMREKAKFSSKFGRFNRKGHLVAKVQQWQRDRRHQRVGQDVDWGKR